jgi:hypothetical protein
MHCGHINNQFISLNHDACTTIIGGDVNVAVVKTEGILYQMRTIPGQERVKKLLK